MKKIILLLGIVITSITFTGLFSKAYASGDVTSTGELPSPGIKPTSKLYALDKFFENLSLKLTFSDEKRVEKLSKIAEERLAELNTLDNEQAQKYSDALFNEYGLDVEKANVYLQQMIADGKLSDKQVERLQNRIQKTEDKQARIKENVRDKISVNVLNQVHNAIANSKMSIFNRFNDLDTIKSLHDEGYGYGALLKLQAISEISNQSINDLLQIENAVTTNDIGDKQINFDTILTSTNITRDQLNEKLKEYRTEIKTDMKNRLNELKAQAKERIKEHSNNGKNPQ